MQVHGALVCIPSDATHTVKDKNTRLCQMDFHAAENLHNLCGQHGCPADLPQQLTINHRSQYPLCKTCSLSHISLLTHYIAYP